MESRKRRRPVEMIERRATRSAECEQRVRTALTKLTKTGAPFTVENVCDLAGVGKTFIYDKRRRQLTEAVLAARDASQAASIARADQKIEQAAASWRERALDAEALAKSLRAEVKQREARINDLTGQLYDPEGNHLAEENARLRDQVNNHTHNLHRAQADIATLRRSLDAARANIKRERERNVTQLFANDDHSH
ncbi:hypothetical protein [Mycolicibacterium fluoranthenivorans]|uniref:Uncharacterized protein n=1 Tax=Mycolicibacterium fluoranthenivorans TaxID=258505 RepID=A0A7X5ZG06_9MYCO|nr:hypothetical protein [Mycolicibacterium fluoranthenivorans]MCV7354626.1 hypothetical protein [Mycolicibacterium fluoranthenivorans]NIH98789.1 hypothetical protein [Mycolicibacterium fluoranthenivorans]